MSSHNDKRKEILKEIIRLTEHSNVDYGHYEAHRAGKKKIKRVTVPWYIKNTGKHIKSSMLCKIL